ncbi:PqqD family protein [Nocardia pseudobrasiliensis]|uniref:Coenzyme PQQ synthesis protein D (PqqD) n=1 Tax=Nocardia pseudobrasiliensis TaxID=45979 RepID=A0A370I8H9_9NOCA|nr:PqqD family protein [Nocardia pseudobrasiliensis]RDI65694.1 coenzyme PQQ synthesis protein D (PqqD) [Nocardia pseudobrasiliensis]
MSLLRLGDDAVLDTTDGVGVIMDTRDGVYFQLNPTATLMVQIAMTCETEAEVVRQLEQRVDASPELLPAGLAEPIGQLTEHRLLARTDAR